MNLTTENITNKVNLKEQWDELKARYPRLRTKNAADKLGVSEAELLASICDGKTVIRLNREWESILAHVETLGEVMALTRNEAAVHEKTGVYANASFQGHAGVVINGEIDLRVFLKRWVFAFAAPVENPRGTLHSLQFFDKEGSAVHKIYLRDAARLEAYNALTEKFRAEDQSPGVVITDSVKRPKNLPVEEIDVNDLLDNWESLKDTHAFYPLLRKYKVARTDALRLAEGRFAWRIENSDVQDMLEAAAAREVPIMVFVGNKGMIQIHSGPVKKVKILNEWINILDPGFNLHLRSNLISETWVVEKPTEDGVVTSIESFDKEGEIIVTFFGARKPGLPEREEWRKLVQDLKEGALQ